MVYNSCDAAQNQFGIGHGWRLNVSHHVHKETITDEEHYVYTDEDGTRHYFTKADKKDAEDKEYYEDQSGLSLKLYVGDALEIVTKAHLRMVFPLPTNTTAQMITSITDACDNQINFTYTSGKLTRVTDGAGRATIIAYPGNATDGRGKGCGTGAYNDDKL